MIAKEGSLLEANGGRRPGTLANAPAPSGGVSGRMGEDTLR